MPVEQFADEPGTRLTTLPDMLGNTPTYVNRWDGDGEYHQIYRNGAAYTMNPAVLAGQFPTLTPGRRNVFHLFRQTQSASRQDGVLGETRDTLDNSDAITMTTTVSISYHPRWLWLAP
jgi:hypothetical protein